MEKCTPKESEFGTIIGEGYGGNVVQRRGGAVVFISNAFNPLSAGELREIASFIDSVAPECSEPYCKGHCGLVHP